MKELIRDLTAEDRGALAVFWRENCPDPNKVARFLADRGIIEPIQGLWGLGSMLLMGGSQATVNGHGYYEVVEGVFYAFAKGLVLFVHKSDNFSYQLAGWLEREEIIYRVDPLIPQERAAMVMPITIGPRGGNHKHAPELTIEARWNIGAGQGEAYGGCYISTQRWLEMQQRFDEWF